MVEELHGAEEKKEWCRGNNNMECESVLISVVKRKLCGSGLLSDIILHPHSSFLFTIQVLTVLLTCCAFLYAHLLLVCLSLQSNHSYEIFFYLEVSF